MRSTCIWSFVLVASVSAYQYRFDDWNNPIKVVGTNTDGQGGVERIMNLYAEIYPRHVTNVERVNFPRRGETEDLFQAIRAPGDERGHLVASQFSGPPIRQNLSPQAPRVNRNLGYRSLTTDWFNTEAEVRRFLDLGGNRYVIWSVAMSYIGNSNRPHEYHLQVAFQNDDAGTSWRPIDTRIANPLLREESTFWTCRQGKKSKRLRLSKDNDDSGKDELRRRRRQDDMPEYDICEEEIPKTGQRGKQ